jgi:hypothetical protein
MRKTLAFLLLLVFCPTMGLAERGYRHPPGPLPYADGSRSSPYPRYHHHHDDEWIVPLAIFGGFLGLLALSQMQPAYVSPAPPRRICRDTYNYYDQYGNYMYSRYVDRPCEE